MSSKRTKLGLLSLSLLIFLVIFPIVVHVQAGQVPDPSSCADADGDGVCDSADACPAQPAKTADGCPREKTPTHTPQQISVEASHTPTPTTDITNTPESGPTTETPLLATVTPIPLTSIARTDFDALSYCAYLFEEGAGVPIYQPADPITGKVADTEIPTVGYLSAYRVGKYVEEVRDTEGTAWIHIQVNTERGTIGTLEEDQLYVDGYIQANAVTTANRNRACDPDDIIPTLFPTLDVEAALKDCESYDTTKAIPSYERVSIAYSDDPCKNLGDYYERVDRLTLREHRNVDFALALAPLESCEVSEAEIIMVGNQMSGSEAETYADNIPEICQGEKPLQPPVSGATLPPERIAVCLSPGSPVPTDQMIQAVDELIDGMFITADLDEQCDSVQLTGWMRGYFPSEAFDALEECSPEAHVSSEDALNAMMLLIGHGAQINEWNGDGEKLCEIAITLRDTGQIIEDPQLPFYDSPVEERLLSTLEVDISGSEAAECRQLLPFHIESYLAYQGADRPVLVKNAPASACAQIYNFVIYGITDPTPPETPPAPPMPLPTSTTDPVANTTPGPDSTPATDVPEPDDEKTREPALGVELWHICSYLANKGIQQPPCTTKQPLAVLAVTENGQTRLVAVGGPETVLQGAEDTPGNKCQPALLSKIEDGRVDHIYAFIQTTQGCDLAPNVEDGKPTLILNITTLLQENRSVPLPPQTEEAGFADENLVPYPEPVQWYTFWRSIAGEVFEIPVILYTVEQDTSTSIRFVYRNELLSDTELVNWNRPAVYDAYSAAVDMATLYYISRRPESNMHVMAISLPGLLDCLLARPKDPDSCVDKEGDREGATDLTLTHPILRDKICTQVIASPDAGIAGGVSQIFMLCHPQGQADQSAVYRLTAGATSPQVLRVGANNEAFAAGNIQAIYPGPAGTWIVFKTSSGLSMSTVFGPEARVLEPIKLFFSDGEVTSLYWVRQD